MDYIFFIYFFFEHTAFHNPFFDYRKCTYCSPAGPVTEVKTDIFVTSFGPVSDVEMVCCPCFITGLRNDAMMRKNNV